MPFFGKKLLFLNYLKKMQNRSVPFCVIFLWLLMAAVLLTGCRSEKDSDVFLLEEPAAVSVTETVMPDTANEPTEDSLTQTEEAMTDGPAIQALFVVHICGAVARPGVYELPENSRVMDAVEAAGGFSEDAAQEARNLAERIVDGSRIYIPTAKEAEAEQNVSDTAAAQAAFSAVDSSLQQESVSTGQSSVNINTADAAQLQTLPGIGESRAAAIIAYREAHGAFVQIEDIMKVSGIKQAAFDKLKDRITV